MAAPAAVAPVLAGRHAQGGYILESADMVGVGGGGEQPARPGRLPNKLQPQRGEVTVIGPYQEPKLLGDDCAGAVGEG